MRKWEMSAMDWNFLADVASAPAVRRWWVTEGESFDEPSTIPLVMRLMIRYAEAQEDTMFSSVPWVVGVWMRMARPELLNMMSCENGQVSVDGIKLPVGMDAVPLWLLRWDHWGQHAAEVAAEYRTLVLLLLQG